MTSAGNPSYAFGDGDIESRRLELVDEVFSPTSRALLDASLYAWRSTEREAGRPVKLAYDLGCGIGRTTEMVASVAKAALTIGLDASAAYVSRARSRPVPDVRYEKHDVRATPFPFGSAEIGFARLLLAHLPDPPRAAEGWATQLVPGGLLVLDEIEWIRTDEPTLAAHLDLVTSVVAATGARMCAGPLLWDLGTGVGRPDGLVRLSAEVVELPVATSRAAGMFELNLLAWGDRAVAADLCTDRHRRELAAALADLCRSGSTGEITWGLHQAAYLRTGGSAT